MIFTRKMTSNRLNTKTSTMKMVPDLNRIGAIVASWQRHVMTVEEAQAKIATALASNRFMPQAELFPDPEPMVASRQAIVTLERVERKLDLLIQHHGIMLPDDMDPEILCSDAKQLADENRKIEAVSLHRARTGASLSQAVQVINRYLSLRRD